MCLARGVEGGEQNVKNNSVMNSYQCNSLKTGVMWLRRWDTF